MGPDGKRPEPALDFFKALDADDQRRVLALFGMLAGTGRIPNREKFKSLGEMGLRLFEFKSFQIRFLGDFRPGKRLVVALGLRKKKDALDRSDVEAAARIMREDDAAGR